MGLTYDDFKGAHRLYYGKIDRRFYFDGSEIFKLKSGEFFIRNDFHILPISGFFPEVEIFKMSNDLVLVFLKDHTYAYIRPIKVIESETIESFTGFEQGKVHKLKNGQEWQQISGPYSNCMSSGYVKIINDEKMIVDGWNFSPNVTLHNDKYL